MTVTKGLDNELYPPEEYVHPHDTNRYNRKKRFSPYKSPKEIEQGLKERIYYQGIIRFTSSYYDAYVTSDTLDSDIYVFSTHRLNRTLHGDLVAVELLEVEPIWEKKKKRDANRKKQQMKTRADRNKENELGKSQEDDSDPEQRIQDELDQEELKPKYCGRVVGILDRDRSILYAGTISAERFSSLKQDQHESGESKGLRIAWFKPLDKKIPFIVLKNRDVPKELLDHEEYFKTHLFVVEILRWQITDKNPTGRIIKELGPVNDLMTQRLAILANHGISEAGFSSIALEGLPHIPWVIPTLEYVRRRDFTLERVFSIDPKTAKDLDDAIHIKPLDDGFYEVGVHIADVSYFLKRDTPLDSEARERGTSIYLVDGVIPMLPRLLCEELCSLNPGVERLAFSVVWKMDTSGKIVDTWFGKTIIKSCAKITYEEAQKVIEGHLLDSGVKIYGHRHRLGITRDILLLFKLSFAMRERRYSNGCLTMRSVRLEFELDEYGEPISVFKYEPKESNQLIEEFMLCANISVAQKIYQTFPRESLLRRHDEPLQRRLSEFEKISDVLGLYFNVETAGMLQASFDGVQNEKVKDVMLSLAIRCMQRAKYFCAGSIDKSKYGHYALSEKLYTHFTSPIRRYPDVIVHRLLEAALEYDRNERTVTPPYTTKATEKIAFGSNRKKNSAKNAQDENKMLYLAKYLTRKEELSGPIYSNAIVTVITKKAYDVYISEFGIEKRIQLQDLPINKSNFDRKTLALDIYWKEGIPVTMHNEEKVYAEERFRLDDYSDNEEEQVIDSLSALQLQEITEYNKRVDANELISKVELDKTQCMQRLKMFSIVDIRIQVNMDRSPPIINIYPVNPF